MTCETRVTLIRAGRWPLIRIDRRGILRPFDGGRLVQRQPIVVDGDDGVLELGEVQRLGEERCRAQPVGTVYLKHILARGQDDCSQFSEVRLPLNPFKHFEAVFARHLEVEQQHAWQGILIPICEPAFAGEVRNRLLAVPDILNGRFKADVFEGTPEQEKIVFSIFCDQDDWLIKRVHATPATRVLCGIRG